MRDSVKEFFAALHKEHLQKRGFKKVRLTYSRSMGDYTERVQIQGSSWNDSRTNWRFYINFGIEFRGLKPRSPCRDFPGTHCWARLASIVHRVQSECELPKTGLKEFARLIADQIDRASQLVARRIGLLRAAYLGKSSPLLALR